MLLLQEGWVVRRWPIVVGRQGWSRIEICPPWWERDRKNHVDALIILCPRWEKVELQELGLDLDTCLDPGEACLVSWVWGFIVLLCKFDVRSSLYMRLELSFLWLGDIYATLPVETIHIVTRNVPNTCNNTLPINMEWLSIFQSDILYNYYKKIFSNHFWPRWQPS